MDIKSAEFIISNTDYLKCPDSRLPEYAFIGRSNVGKSSLINMLCDRKGLAMTSSKPGKTLLINHFLINKNWHLVDLPGYGYATTGKKMREQLQEVLHTLTPREEKVIRLRFGLEDGQAHTLEEVGKEFNVTRERIRQIEAKALRKIRHPGRSKKLRDYYTE